MEASFLSFRSSLIHYSRFSYFAPIFKIQIVKKIKAAGGFFCTL
nr:MAG TPA: hypothetical protein [Caudoviricetes sp.]